MSCAIAPLGETSPTEASPAQAPTPSTAPLPSAAARPPIVPAAAAATPVSARYERTDLSRLPNVSEADMLAAWPVWVEACKTLPEASRTRNVPWKPVCEAASRIDPKSYSAIRAYWIANFNVWAVVPLDQTGAAVRGRLTGYFEPELVGSRRRTAVYNVPLARAPTDLVTVDLASALPELAGQRLRGRLVEDANKRLLIQPYWTRAELTQGNRLHGLEIVWVNDPIEAFFLQVQGSGRVRIAEGVDKGRVIRLGYADTNGHPYRSIGRWLVEQGEMLPEQASAQGIRDWVRANPKRLSELLNYNPSYIFFRELPLGNANAGPVGSLNLALTAGYGAAVDPNYTPLGAPIIISSTHPGTRAPLNRMVVALDTGSAIRGPGRVDLFWGTGPEAGSLAGRSRDEVTVWMLLPKGVTPGAELGQ